VSSIRSHEVAARAEPQPRLRKGESLGSQIGRGYDRPREPAGGERCLQGASLIPDRLDNRPLSGDTWRPCIEASLSIDIPRL